MSLTTDVILIPAKLAFGFAKQLLKDIRPDQFARLARGVQSNHPAWAFGHLSIYPDRALDLIGRTDLARHDERFVSLFQSKAPCLDDPAGTIYPSMEEIVSRYTTRTEAILGVVPEISDATLNRTLTDPMAERLPTVGSRLAFLLGAHTMVHLGQVSAWRRFMGLPSAM